MKEQVKNVNTTLDFMSMFKIALAEGDVVTLANDINPVSDYLGFIFKYHPEDELKFFSQNNNTFYIVVGHGEDVSDIYHMNMDGDLFLAGKPVKKESFLKNSVKKKFNFMDALKRTAELAVTGLTIAVLLTVLKDRYGE